MTEPDPATLDGLTTDAVKGAMGKPVSSPEDNIWLDDCVAYVGQYAERMRVSNGLTQAAALWAAKMHSMRLFNRRSSTTGVVAFDLGAAVRITKTDPDIAAAYRANRPKIG